MTTSTVPLIDFITRQTLDQLAADTGDCSDITADAIAVLVRDYGYDPLDAINRVTLLTDGGGA